jgi:hypothetical protein
MNLRCSVGTDFSCGGFTYDTNFPLVSSLRIFGQTILEMPYLDRVHLVHKWNRAEKFRDKKNTYC